MAEIFNSSKTSIIANSAHLYIMDNFIRNIITFCLRYTPIDTGRLLSSLYIKADEVDKIRIGYDLNIAPYAVYVHEIPNIHLNGTRHKFLEDAIIDAKKLTPGAEEINVVVNIIQTNKGGLLEATLNGKEDDFGQYTKAVTESTDLKILTNQFISKSDEEGFNLESMLKNAADLESVTNQLIYSLPASQKVALMNNKNTTKNDLRNALVSQVGQLKFKMPIRFNLNRRPLNI